MTVVPYATPWHGRGFSGAANVNAMDPAMDGRALVGNGAEGSGVGGGVAS